MTNKEYAIKLTKSIREQQARLIEKKPHSRNLNQDNYAKALEIWQNEYNKLEQDKKEILQWYKEGVDFIQV